MRSHARTVVTVLLALASASLLAYWALETPAEPRRVDWSKPIVPKFGRHPRARADGYIIKLEQGGHRLVRIGDSTDAVREAMGTPDEERGDGIKGPILTW